MQKLIFLLLLLFSLQVKAQTYKSENGTVSFFSEAPLENIDATSKHLVSAINIANGEIVFEVAIKSMQFENKKMQDDFNEDFMDSDKFPLAIYRGKINEKIDWLKNGTHKITSYGILTIHGVGKERADTATVIIKDGKIAMNGDFRVKVSDHKIKIPKLLFQKIAEVVTVKFTCNYKKAAK
jgi:hypothetical protein